MSEKCTKKSNIRFVYRLFGTFKLCCGSWSKLDRIQHLSLSGSIFRIQIHIIKKGGLQAPKLLKFFLKEVFQRINCYKKIVSIICPKLIIQIGVDFRIQFVLGSTTLHIRRSKNCSVQDIKEMFLPKTAKPQITNVWLLLRLCFIL